MWRRTGWELTKGTASRKARGIAYSIQRLALMADYPLFLAKSPSGLNSSSRMKTMKTPRSLSWDEI